MNVYRDHVSEPAGADSSRNANGGRRILANAETAVSVSTSTSRQTGTSVPSLASSQKRSKVTISDQEIGDRRRETGKERNVGFRVPEPSDGPQSFPVSRLLS